MLTAGTPHAHAKRKWNKANKSTDNAWRRSVNGRLRKLEREEHSDSTSNSDEDEVVRRINGEVDAESTEPGPSRGKQSLQGREVKRGGFVREGDFEDKFRLPVSFVDDRETDVLIES